MLTSLLLAAASAAGPVVAAGQQARQILEAPDSLVNEVTFKTLGFIPGYSRQYGTIKPLSGDTFLVCGGGGAPPQQQQQQQQQQSNSNTATGQLRNSCMQQAMHYNCSLAMAGIHVLAPLSGFVSLQQSLP
jgi:hypothetical protein